MESKRIIDEFSNLDDKKIKQLETETKRKLGRYGEIREDYFLYLCSLVQVGYNQDANNYVNLLRRLYLTSFFWSVPGDLNRSEDGKNLRDGYFVRSDWVDYTAINGPCNFLEFLIALSSRIDRDIANQLLDNNHDRTIDWFWMIIENLGFLSCPDEKWTVEIGNFVSDKLNYIMTRQFDDNGIGGMFPLKEYNYIPDSNKKSQKCVEFWAQANYYFVEHSELLE